MKKEGFYMKEKDITIWRFNLHTHNGSEEQMKVLPKN